MKTFKEIREGAENYTMKKGPYTRKVDGKTADRMKRQGWKLVAREEVEEARQMKNPKKDSMVQKGGKTIVIDKSKEKEYLRKGWSLAEAFEPHKMYDPKTGKEYDAKTKDDHERMKKLGYSHEKPEVKESVLEAYFQKELEPSDYIRGSEKMYVDIIKKNGGKNIKVYKPTRQDPQLAIDFEGGNIKKITQELKKRGDGTETIDEGVLQEKYEYDPDVPRHAINPSVLVKIKASVRDYKTLARKGMGTETKKEARVGLEIDFYDTERGDKVFGKIIKVTGTGYTVQAQERGNNKKYTFKFHDRAKAKKLMSESYSDISTEAISYGRPKKSTEKDSADVDDYKATSDDRKAADKNVIMQIRRGVDMPKGCTVTFQDGKTQKFPQKACQLVAKKFDSFKKPAVRKKFQDEINKSLPSMKKAMNMKG